MSKRKIPLSTDPDDFKAELGFAGDRADLVKRIDRLMGALEKLGLDETDRRLIELGRGEKKNFAQRFSEALAQKIADSLRKDFPGIQPDADGVGHESLSKSAKGVKKIDVNYSSRRGGLELAVSIKTINFKDKKSGRYTKNTQRIDAELRAEAEDVHMRQPFAVLVAYLFLPVEAANDGKTSSVKHNAAALAVRSGRVDTRNGNSQIELAFIGLYTDEGRISFFPPDSVPLTGLPSNPMTFQETLADVKRVYARRNPRK